LIVNLLEYNEIFYAYLGTIMSFKALGLAVSIFFLSSTNSFAYLDMGTGSYIIQAILAGFFASLFFIKTYWFKLSAFISKILGKSKED
jgi:hypothetical protein